MLAALILGFAMANFSFVESSGQMDNAIMIVKENNIVVDTDIVVIVNLDPAGQTAQNCKSVCRSCAHAKSFHSKQLWISLLELYPYLLHSLHLTTHGQYHWRLLKTV